MAQSPEHATQKAYFDWARLHPVARRAFAIPNGGQRNIIVASKLKAEGTRAGVLDVNLCVARGSCHGMWIEFKAGKNKLSDLQEEEANQLAKDGYAVAVCWDSLSAIGFTTEYLRGGIEPGVHFFR